MINHINVTEQANDLYTEIAGHWESVIKDDNFVMGNEVTIFENWMSERCHGSHAVSMNSGTDALIPDPNNRAN